MARMVLSRALFGLLTLLIVSFVVFAATQALPGDAARAILGKEATPERLAALRAQLHLGGSLPSQYFHWLGNVLRLDLGTSLAAQAPVKGLLGPTLVNSSVLMAISAVVATPLSILIGTWSALRKDTKSDEATGIVTLIFASFPEFVTGIFLVTLFSTSVFHWLPAVSLGTGEVWSQPSQLVLPSLTLILAVSPYMIRIMRSTMLEVLQSPYVQQARLKGVPERTVILRHAMPNAVGPVVQVIALQLAWMVGGVVLIEYLFRYPGIGFQLTDAVTNRDMPLVQAIVLVIALFYVAVNLVADVITMLANPKVRTTL